MNPNLEFPQLWSHGVKFPGFSLVCLERQDLESVILNSNLLLVAIPFQMFCDEQNPIDKHSLIHPFIILSIHLSIRSASLHAQMVW